MNIKTYILAILYGLTLLSFPGCSWSGGTKKAKSDVIYQDTMISLLYGVAR